MKRRNPSYERDTKYKQKLKRLYEYTKNNYPSACFPVNQDDIMILRIQFIIRGFISAKAEEDVLHRIINVRQIKL